MLNLRRLLIFIVFVLLFPEHIIATTSSFAKRAIFEGLWERKIPACIDCHGPRLRGIQPHFPSLRGNSKGYVYRTLESFQTKNRISKVNQIMNVISGKLSKREMKDLAAFIANFRDTQTLASYIKFPKQKDVQNGYQLFIRTKALLKDQTGNQQNCRHCHLSHGYLAGSAPMWAAYQHYPAYRKKNNRINTIEDRVRGCFKYSMNADLARIPKDAIRDIVSFIKETSLSRQMRTNLPGRGYNRLPPPSKQPSRTRGNKLFVQKCVFCHQKNGSGRIIKGEPIFPALWGKKSYNWGAGMHELTKSAAFIKANMPYGIGGSLTNQQAWDLAAYINSHQRPEDPRKKQNGSRTLRKHHQHKCYYEGQRPRF